MTVLLRPGARILSSTVLATAGDTGGRYSLYRIDLPPRSGGARPHFHRRFAESFTVLSGVVTLYDGRAWVPAGRDDHLFVPEEGVHGSTTTATSPPRCS